MTQRARSRACFKTRTLQPAARPCPPAHRSPLLQDRLEHLRKQCGPHVSAAAKDSVEGICSKIYHISLEYVKRIREKHLAILKENNIPGRAGRQGASRGAVSPVC